jgi:hypothetical protein
MEEIAPVVGGQGSPDDTTTKGWGVVIDTIEIQHVRITSEQVFAHLQAPYRAEIAGRAELAELERARQVDERRAQTERARVEQVAAVARRQAELDRERELHDIAIAEEARRTKAAADVAAMEAERVRAEASHRAALLDLEHDLRTENHKQDAEHARARKQADLAVEVRRREAEAREHENALDHAHQQRLAELEQALAQVRASRDLIAALPAVARALQANYGNVTYTQIGNDASTGPLGSVPAALAQLLALARGFGVELPRRDV